jgi:hypothetical protein
MAGAGIGYGFEVVRPREDGEIPLGRVDWSVGWPVEVGWVALVGRMAGEEEAIERI